jgi:hypothetical protein
VVAVGVAVGVVVAVAVVVAVDMNRAHLDDLKFRK